jgi:hypothetical protein
LINTSALGCFYPSQRFLTTALMARVTRQKRFPEYFRR